MAACSTLLQSTGSFAVQGSGELPNMRYGRLGGSDLNVSRICLGGSNFGARTDRPQSKRLIEAAIDLGINFFDTAPSYSNGESERIFGESLKAASQEIIISTKFGRAGAPPHPRQTGRYIAASCERSLRRLAIERIDLYTVHKWDEMTPVEEVVAVLNALKAAGKIRYFGASNFSPQQVAEFARLSGGAFVALQGEYSLVKRDYGEQVGKVCKARAVGFTPYYTLASGYLTGKWMTASFANLKTRLKEEKFENRYRNAANDEIVRLIARIAERNKVSPACVALGWVLGKPWVASALVGVTSVEQLRENVSCMEIDVADLYEPLEAHIHRDRETI